MRKATSRVVDKPAWDFQPLHRHADARLVVFLGGAYVERAFTRASAFAPGDFVIRPSYYAHDGAAGADGARYVRLGFTAAAARRFFARHGWTPRRGCLTLDEWTFADMTRDASGGDELLASERTEAYDIATARSATETIAAKLMSDNYMTMDALAEAHGLKPWALTRRFHRAFGMSPSAFRLHARVQCALRLIAESDTSMSAIAAEAGFADQSHLCRAVKQAVGVTPAALRREIALG